jgi:predicted aldo/keto reductase-like oxidoreductase
VLLATKYAFDAADSAEDRTAGLRNSLERLQTDHVDVLQLHGGIYDDDLAERILGSGVLDWADEMRARGLCRWTGITAEGPSGALERLLRTGRFDVLEMNYNLIYQAACDYQRAPTGIIPLARSLGIGVTTMRPTTCGFLQKLFAAEFGDVVDRDRLTRLAIRFVLSTPEVDCAVVGMRTADEVAANLDLATDPSARLDLAVLHDRYG